MNAKGIKMITIPNQTSGISTSTRTIVFQLCRQACIAISLHGLRDVTTVVTNAAGDHDSKN